MAPAQPERRAHPKKQRSDKDSPVHPWRKMLDDYGAMYPLAPTSATANQNTFRIEYPVKFKAFAADGRFAAASPWAPKPPHSSKASRGAPKNRSHQRVQPSRFLELPAELRNSVYEQFAYNTFLEGWPVTATADARSFLSTCCQIRREFIPVLFEHAEIRLKVDSWNFDLFAKMYAHVEEFPLARKAVDANQRTHSVLRASQWHFDEDVRRIDLWFATCLDHPTMGFTYGAKCPSDLRIESSHQSAWMLGLEELRSLERSLLFAREGFRDDFKRQELRLIIQAFEKQVQLEANCTATKESHEQRQNALATAYGMQPTKQAVVKKHIRMMKEMKKREQRSEEKWEKKMEKEERGRERGREREREREKAKRGEALS